MGAVMVVAWVMVVAVAVMAAVMAVVKQMQYLSKK
jgi:hypothetical protein